jgi:hypothetical protein
MGMHEPVRLIAGDQGPVSVVVVPYPMPVVTMPGPVRVTSLSSARKHSSTESDSEGRQIPSFRFIISISCSLTRNPMSSIPYLSVPLPLALHIVGLSSSSRPFFWIFLLPSLFYIGISHYTIQDYDVIIPSTFRF